MAYNNAESPYDGQTNLYPSFEANAAHLSPYFKQYAVEAPKAKSEDLTEAEEVASAANLSRSSSTELSGSDEEEGEESSEQLFYFNSPLGYRDAIKKSESLAAISTVTDARTRLTREQLEDDLEALDSEAYALAQLIVSSADVNASVFDVYERESGLRYWHVSADSTKQLYSEWIRFFQVCPHYLALAPFDVQEMVEALHTAPIEVQKRALRVTFSSRLPDIHNSRKRPLAAKDAETEWSSAKRHRSDSSETDPGEPFEGYEKVDTVKGRKVARWSRGRLNAWKRIKNIQVSDRPDLVFHRFRHELESSCTPVAADIRLCKVPVSIEETLTYFPDHTYWREIGQRLKKYWPASIISYFILRSRSIRDKMGLERSTLHHRLDLAAKAHIIPHATTVTGSMENVSCESGVQDLRPHDVFVGDLAEGVRHHPTGKGAQLLTRVVQHVLAHEDPYGTRVKLSELMDYATRHGITVPEEDKMGPVAEVEDEAALERHSKASKDWYEIYISKSKNHRSLGRRRL